MSDKYRAISNLMQLRQLERVPTTDNRKDTWCPKSSELTTFVINTRASQSSMANFNAAAASAADQEESKERFAPTNEVESAPAFKNIRLSDEEQDSVLLDLGKYLLEKNLAEFAETCISWVEDKMNFNYLGCQAKVKILQGKLGEEIDLIEQMLEMDATWLEGYILIGHSKYKRGMLEDALTSYLKAIRVANLTQQEITDPLVYQRTGDVYAKLEKWEDARVMFIMCAEDYKTAFSHYNLGVASYQLGQYDEAERVLSLVNYMDPTHALTWAYLALVLLRKPDPPLYAAYQTMNEAVKLGLTDAGCMYDIAMNWIDQSSFLAAKEALEHSILIKVGQGNGGIVNEFTGQAQEILDLYKESDQDKIRTALKNLVARTMKRKAMLKAQDIVDTYV